MGPLILKTDQYLNKAKLWFEENELILNENKTNILIFRTSRCTKEIPQSINVLNQDFEVNEYTKFLGLYIDQFLKWDKHVDYTSRKLNRICFSFRVASRYMNVETMRMLYHSNFESVLRYGMIFWGSANVHDIFVCQKRAIRLCFGMGYRDSCRGIFREKRILTVYALYVFECLMFLYKNKHLFLQNNLNFTYETRTQNITFPLHRYTLFEKNPVYSSIKLFNRLPNSVKAVNVYKRFRNKVKKLLLDLEPYSMQDYFDNIK